MFHILIAQLKRTRCPSGNFRSSTEWAEHTGALYTCTLTSLDTAGPFPISKSFQEEAEGVSAVYVMSQWHFAEMIVHWDLHIWNSLQGGLWELQPNLLSALRGVILFQEPAATDGSRKMQRSAKGPQLCRTQWGLKATHKNETSPWSFLISGKKCVFEGRYYWTNTKLKNRYALNESLAKSLFKKIKKQIRKKTHTFTVQYLWNKLYFQLKKGAIVRDTWWHS